LLAIHSFLEEHVSVESFSEKVHNTAGGAPAVYPKMMLKVLFYSYAKGIYFSQEIEDRLKWDPHLKTQHSCYIYLGANQKVDYSTICNFIVPFGGMGEKPLTLVKDFSIRKIYNTIARVPIRFTI
jgi:transposase